MYIFGYYPLSESESCYIKATSPSGRSNFFPPAIVPLRVNTAYLYAFMSNNSNMQLLASFETDILLDIVLALRSSLLIPLSVTGKVPYFTRYMLSLILSP